MEGVIPEAASPQKKPVSSPPRNSPGRSNQNEWASISYHSPGPAVAMFTWFGKKTAEESRAQSEGSAIVVCVRAREETALHTAHHSFKVVMGVKKKKKWSWASKNLINMKPGTRVTFLFC